MVFQGFVDGFLGGIAGLIDGVLGPVLQPFDIELILGEGLLALVEHGLALGFQFLPELGGFFATHLVFPAGAGKQEGGDDTGSEGSGAERERMFATTLVEAGEKVCINVSDESSQPPDARHAGSTAAPFRSLP